MSNFVITKHARERWVERVVDPKRYSHLSVCREPHCSQCVSLINDINCVITTVKHGLNKSITALYHKFSNNKITDTTFLQAIRKNYSDSEFVKYSFLDCGKCIFVVYDSDDQKILKTVLKRDMLEGSIFRNLNKEEIGDAFNRWKFEARQGKIG